MEWIVALVSVVGVVALAVIVGVSLSKISDVGGEDARW